MLNWIRGFFTPTELNIVFFRDTGDPVQDGVDTIADGINILLRSGYPPDELSGLLFKMSTDILNGDACGYIAEDERTRH